MDIFIHYDYDIGTVLFENFFLLIDGWSLIGTRFILEALHLLSIKSKTFFFLKIKVKEANTVTKLIVSVKGGTWLIF